MRFWREVAKTSNPGDVAAFPNWSASIFCASNAEAIVEAKLDFPSPGLSAASSGKEACLRQNAQLGESRELGDCVLCRVSWTFELSLRFSYPQAVSMPVSHYSRDCAPWTLMCPWMHYHTQIDPLAATSDQLCLRLVYTGRRMRFSTDTCLVIRCSHQGGLLRRQGLLQKSMLKILAVYMGTSSQACRMKIIAPRTSTRTSTSMSLLLCERDKA